MEQKVVTFNYKKFNLKRETPIQIVKVVTKLVSIHGQNTFIQKITNDQQKQIFLNILKYIQYLKVEQFKYQRYPDSKQDQFLRLKDFQHIKFLYLRKLQISSQKINNLQSLLFINMPYVQTINLNSNIFVSLRPLNKLLMRQLQCLKLERNKFVGYQLVHLSKMQAPFLERVDLGRQQALESSYDFFPLIKICRNAKNKKKHQGMHISVPIFIRIHYNRKLRSVANKFVTLKF